MTNDDKARFQRPEGKLIERAMAGPPRISGRQLAKDADLSEGRVRQIINGYKSESGMQLPVIAPAETLARLTAVLGISPQELTDAGREDAAEIARGDLSSGITEEGDLWLSDLNDFRIELLDWLQGGVESNPPSGPLMLWSMDELLEAVARKHRDETSFLSNLVTLSRRREAGGGDGDADDAPGGSAQNTEFNHELYLDEAAYPKDEPDKK